MSHAIRVHQPGGPEVLRWEEVDVGEPGPGQVRLRQEAAGLNFIDVYHRTGLYPQKTPFTPGVEGAGIIDAVGSEVSGLSIGDRVAYAGQIGGYAEERLIDAGRVVNPALRVGRSAVGSTILGDLDRQVVTFPRHAGDDLVEALREDVPADVGTRLLTWRFGPLLSPRA